MKTLSKPNAMLACIPCIHLIKPAEPLCMFCKFIANASCLHTQRGRSRMSLSFSMACTEQTSVQQDQPKADLVPSCLLSFWQLSCGHQGVTTASVTPRQSIMKQNKRWLQGGPEPLFLTTRFAEQLLLQVQCPVNKFKRHEVVEV
jgi:hypothetical protein